MRCPTCQTELPRSPPVFCRTCRTAVLASQPSPVGRRWEHWALRIPLDNLTTQPSGYVFPDMQRRYDVLVAEQLDALVADGWAPVRPPQWELTEKEWHTRSTGRMEVPTGEDRTLIFTGVTVLLRRLVPDAAASRPDEPA